MQAPRLLHWTDPHSWPTIVYVWLAFVIAGAIPSIFRWYQRTRANGWPTVPGTITAVNVRPKSQWWSSGSRAVGYTAVLSYSYSVAGEFYTGRFEHPCATQAEADEYVRALGGAAVAVSFNPARPGQSSLTKQSIAQAQAARAPATDPEAPLRPVSPLPSWARPLLWPFIFLAAAGWCTSLWVHIEALAGTIPVPEAFFFLLHIGIFVVFIPAVLVAQRLVGNTHRRDFWKAALRWCPDWMRYLVYCSLGYALLNFMIFLTHVQSHSGQPNATDFRGFSGHWMAFYSASLALLYSGANSPGEAARGA